MKQEQSLTEILKNNLSGDKYILHVKSEHEERPVSYAQLYQKALQILFQFQDWGLKPGNEFLILIEERELFLAVFWACLLGKIIAVPLSAASNGENKLKILKIWSKLSNPHLIASQKFIEDLEKFTVEKNMALKDGLKSKAFPVEHIQETVCEGRIFQASPEDIAFIQFSSGSTGDPKGVTLTHKNLLTNIKAIIQSAELTREDSTLSWLPLTHDMGLIGFHLVPLVLGINQSILPTSLFVRYPMMWLAKASQHKATLLSSPNFGYQYFLSFFKPECAVNWDLSKVRLIFNGAEPISAKLCGQFTTEMRKFGLKENVIFPVYGLAEASLAVTFPPMGEKLIRVHLNRHYLAIGQAALETEEADQALTVVDVGYPVAGCSIRICDPENRVLAHGKIGYIQIKGANVTSGYYNDSQADARIISDDGWLNTGDLGFIRRGRLVITGRAKEIIFMNGQNYYPQDLERIAEEVDGIQPGEVVTFGVLNEERQNEDIILAVLFKKEVAKFLPLATTLKRHIRKQTGLEVKEIIPVKKIPKTTSGKFMRLKLKEMYQKGDFENIIREIGKLNPESLPLRKFNPADNIIEDQLLRILSWLLMDEDLTLDDNFLEMSCNSLILASFCAQIEKENIARISIVDLFSYPSIRKLAEYISGGQDRHRSSISCLQLRLAQEFFHQEADFNSRAEDSAFLYRLPPELANHLKAISRMEKITMAEILLALFIYRLEILAKQPEVAVQTMVERENQVGVVIVNFDTIDEVGQLFQAVHSECMNGQGTMDSLQNICRMNLAKERFAIVPFFYQEQLMTEKCDFLHIYDIACGVLETGHTAELIFEYNNERLNRQKMEEYVQAFVQSVYDIDAVFKMKYKEIAG
ncbi:MAG TPA: peptide synthetase [Firmicutes bacterium]|jgi:fatty-acyl-CoA synthase|nr:peptide synthetase [Bacillota bacterium]